MENEEYVEDSPPVDTEPRWKKILHLTSNAVTLNLLFLLSCLPIVTIGQAWCGLYSAIRYMIRGDGWFDGFKAGFKTRFLRGTVAWILCFLVDAYLVVNVFFTAYYQWNGNIGALVVQCIFLLIALMFTAALIPLNVYIPTGKLQWVKNAITLTFTSPLQMALVAVLMWLPVASVLLMMWDTIFFVIFVVMFLIVYFALVVLVATIALKDPLIRIKKEMEEMEQQEEG